MRRTLALLARNSATTGSRPSSSPNPNLIQIRQGTFYREHPTADGSDAVSNPALFRHLNFELPATRVADIGKNIRQGDHWAVVAANDGTTFLEILRGSHLCFPPNTRTFPYLSSDEIDQRDHRLRVPSRAIQYVGFNAAKGQSMGGGLRGAYLSARYEARREETDWSLLQYLKGETELNPSYDIATQNADDQLLQQVIKDLRLQKLLDMPVSHLSNGQTRRSRIAKALLNKPELLLLDEPFMGLDPPTLVTLSPILRDLAFRSSPLLLLALRPQDPIPEWITHLAILGQHHTVAMSGPKSEILATLHTWIQGWRSPSQDAPPLDNGLTAEQMTKLYGPPLLSVGDTLSEKGVLKYTSEAQVSTEKAETLQQMSQKHLGDPLIELQSVVVKYGDKVVLGYPPPQPGYAEPGLNLTIYQGTKLALLGPNGSGKTTLLSLLTSDHPQSYSLPIRFFGRTRLPSPGKPGLSLWDIQSRLGHSSPEIHAFFPKRLNIRQVLESAWSETYAARPKLSYERDEMVNAFLRWWEPELRQDKPHVSSSALDTSKSKAWKAPSIKHLVDQSYPPLISPTSTFAGEDAILSYKNSYDGLDWAEDSNNHAFSVLPFGTQRLLLLLRAIIKQPDIVILDEAFSGLSGEARDKAMSWLEFGETRYPNSRTSEPSITSATLPNRRIDVLRIAKHFDADLELLIRDRKRAGGYTEIRKMSEDELLDVSDKVAHDPSASKTLDYHFKGLIDKQAVVVVSHVKEEIPAFVDEYVRLSGEDEVAETGRPVETGRCDGGSIRSAEGWNRVWGF